MVNKERGRTGGVLGCDGDTARRQRVRPVTVWVSVRALTGGCPPPRACAVVFAPSHVAPRVRQHRQLVAVTSKMACRFFVLFVFWREAEGVERVPSELPGQHIPPSCTQVHGAGGGHHKGRWKVSVLGGGGGAYPTVLCMPEAFHCE